MLNYESTGSILVEVNLYSLHTQRSPKRRKCEENEKKKQGHECSLSEILPC